MLVVDCGTLLLATSCWSVLVVVEHLGHGVRTRVQSKTIWGAEL